MSHTLILGSNRGIGLELVRRHLDRGHSVTATCRQTSKALDATGATVIEGIDLRHTDDLIRLRDTLDRPVDRLVVCAGILRGDRLESLADEGFGGVSEQLAGNALAPLQAVVTLLPKLAKGARVGLITSRMGSIADNGSGGQYGYRMSKAALNAAGRSLAIDLAPRDIHVALLHPGFVRTEMTGGRGDVEASESAESLAQRLDELDASRSGRFWHAKGEELPW
ncbi:SDR family oxidoreductase [Pseudomarimonas salicorniae]|uniref:SDR family oxidoreductase n=1 Tax=Pseudomarimonas salicorniae TaxID=2933270 RepID=A0ABT0GJW6_9GAMM|nr:SDR family oxidoreductase [Lysobacter sp. CAU 1642]MCK7594703.1 SDR family oxidoreductase [Lysobacter sp. CAU 1642]